MDGALAPASTQLVYYVRLPLHLLTGFISKIGDDRYEWDALLGASGSEFKYYGKGLGIYR